MMFQVVDQNEWLYPDSTPGSNKKHEALLHAARRSYVSAQLLVTDMIPGESIDISCNDIPFKMEAYQLADVPVEMNTGPKHSCYDSNLAEGYITRKAPFRVFDILMPVKEGATVNTSTGGFYFCWFIPADTSQGIYSGNVKLKIGSESFAFNIKIKAYNAILPEKETLHTTNWFNMSNVSQYHKLEMWSDSHWDMYKKYLKAMRRVHQTYLPVSVDYVTVSCDENGNYHFDFSLIEKIIVTGLSEGFQYVELTALLWRRHFSDEKYFFVIGNNPSPATPEGYKLLVEYLKALGGFLKERNWYDKAVLHIGDEPSGNLVNEYHAVAVVIRKYLPGVPILEALDNMELRGSVDIWIPKSNYLQEHEKEFRELEKLGDELWYYTCCVPVGYFINRFMDIPLIKSRYLAWGNYRYGLKGYLHWAFNQYQPGQDPFLKSCTGCDYTGDMVLPAGDTHIVYPGDDGPWFSVRLEAIRAGIEDYELLKLLEIKDKKLADEIASSCIRKFDDVELDLERFEENRVRILEALEVEL